MRDHLAKFNVADDMQFTKGIVLLDDCEGTNLWAITGTGADFTGTFETGAAFHGTKGLQLVTRTTDPADNDVVTAKRFMPYLAADVLLWRVLVGLPDVSVVRYVSFDFHMFDGSKDRQANMIWRPNTPRLEFKNSAGNTATIAGYAQGVPDGAWVSWSMAFQMDTYKHIFVELNGIKTDMSDEAIYEVGASSSRYVSVGITVVTIGAALATAYFDSMYCGKYLDI